MRIVIVLRFFFEKTFPKNKKIVRTCNKSRNISFVFETLPSRLLLQFIVNERSLSLISVTDRFD